MPDVRNTTRQRRLSAALRENLKRRKAQIKGRAGQPASESEPDRSDEPDSGGLEGKSGKNTGGRPG